jgi:cation transport ATPase
VLLAVDHVAIAALAVADPLKPEAAGVVAALGLKVWLVGVPRAAKGWG